MIGKNRSSAGFLTEECEFGVESIETDYSDLRFTTLLSSLPKKTSNITGHRAVVTSLSFAVF